MYQLYFAPDNASVIVRIALEEAGLEYQDILVDRAVEEQKSEAYRALNPAGLIPVLIMDGQPVHETAAILLALSERHHVLGPGLGDANRSEFLKYLFFLSNTVHIELRQIFYPQIFVGSDGTMIATLRSRARARFLEHLAMLNTRYETGPGPYLYGEALSAVDIYLALFLRWVQLYGDAKEWVFDLAEFPSLKRMTSDFETRPAVIRAFGQEGIHPPFIDKPTGPDGSRGAAV
ncbi:glutathione S-transferase family protein [Coralliovum pocilloporae]|uniref:glutathione S-transferase family protein n=1 Tax=Coralliovum pocilloporae TaxID=3066369 RepID=UPI003306F2F0